MVYVALFKVFVFGIIHHIHGVVVQGKSRKVIILTSSVYTQNAHACRKGPDCRSERQAPYGV